MLPVPDPKVAELIGETEYANVEPGCDPKAAVAGTVFEITEHELAAADRYEEAAGYKRISVTLGSGDQAWLYVQAR